MSEHEMDPLARLRAVDPAAGVTYEHPDVSAMLARVTARPRVERVSFARGFRLRMASAAAAAALVSVGGIVALEAAPSSIPVLALSATSNVHGPGSPEPTSFASGAQSSSEIPMIPADVMFVAGPDLSSQTESAPSYSLTPAGDFGALSQQVATAFGVSGAPSSQPAANSYWTVGNPAGDYLSFWTDSAELNWQYTNASEAGNATPDGTPPSSSTTVPTNQAAALATDNADLAAAESLLAETGVSGPFGTPEFSQSDGGTGISWTTVTLPWDVGGPGAGFQFDVTYDSTGTVIAADGVDVSVATGQSYPLISQVAGVAALNAQETDLFGSGTTTTTAGPTQPGADVNPGGPMVPATTTTTAPSSGSDGSPSGDGSTSSPASGRTPRVVTLTAASIQYAEYALSDGSEVLLPEWSYTGDDGSQWSVLAVDPAYVSIGGSSGGIATPQMY